MAYQRFPEIRSAVQVILNQGWCPPIRARGFPNTCQHHAVPLEAPEHQPRRRHHRAVSLSGLPAMALAVWGGNPHQPHL